MQISIQFQFHEGILIGHHHNIHLNLNHCSMEMQGFDFYILFALIPSVNINFFDKIKFNILFVGEDDVRVLYLRSHLRLS